MKRSTSWPISVSGGALVFVDIIYVLFFVDFINVPAPAIAGNSNSRNRERKRVSAETNKASVALVGGGNLGGELAKAIEDKLHATLIELSKAVTQARAVIRAMVDPAALEHALIRCDRLLTEGRFVEGEVRSVDGDAVGLAHGPRIEADYIVLATGARNLAPFKSIDGRVDALRAVSAEWYSALVAAHSVAIIGARAVGTELADEIAGVMPNEKVMLFSSDDALLPRSPTKLGVSLPCKFKAMDVEVVLGERFEHLLTRDTPSGGAVTLTSGRQLDVDLIVCAVGAKVHDDLVDLLPNTQRGPDGRVRTDLWMRPTWLPITFASDDMADTVDLMKIAMVPRQMTWRAREMPWRARTAKVSAPGPSIGSQKSHKPWGKASILLSLGTKRGSSSLRIATVGDWITRTMKGRGLFTDKNRKLFGAT